MASTLLPVQRISAFCLGCKTRHSDSQEYGPEELSLITPIYDIVSVRP